MGEGGWRGARGADGILSLGSPKILKFSVRMAEVVAAVMEAGLVYADLLEGGGGGRGGGD